MVIPRLFVNFVIILNKLGESCWSPRSASGRPSSCCPALAPGTGGRGPGVNHELEPAVTVATHLPLGVQTLAVPADAVAALDALVGVLGADLVTVTSINDWQLRESLHCLLCPSPPQGTVTITITGDDPGGGMTHLMDQSVPETISSVYHLGAQLYPAGSRLYIELLVSSGVTEAGGLGEPDIPRDLHVVWQCVVKTLCIVHLIKSLGQFFLGLLEVLDIRQSLWMASLYGGVHGQGGKKSQGGGGVGGSCETIIRFLITRFRLRFL